MFPFPNASKIEAILIFLLSLFCLEVQGREQFRNLVRFVGQGFCNTVQPVISTERAFRVGGVHLPGFIAEMQRDGAALSGLEARLDRE